MHQRVTSAVVRNTLNPYYSSADENEIRQKTKITEQDHKGNYQTPFEM